MKKLAICLVAVAEIIGTGSASWAQSTQATTGDVFSRLQALEASNAALTKKNAALANENAALRKHVKLSEENAKPRVRGSALKNSKQIAAARRNSTTPGSALGLDAAQSGGNNNSSATPASNTLFNQLVPEWGDLCKLPNSPANSAMYHCAPGLSFYAGIMYLQRSRSSGSVATTTTSTPLLDTNSFQYGYNASPEAVLQVRPGDGWAIEGRYFNDRSTLSGPVGLSDVTSFRTAGIGVTILGGGPLSMTTSSQLTSAEINVLKQITPGLALLGGYRRISLNDGVTEIIDNPSITVAWQERNVMEGEQIGAKLAFVSPGFSALQFDVTGKTGIYRNSVSNIFTSDIVSSTSATASTRAYVSEVNIGATLQLGSNVALHGGYMMLWLDHVALAGAAAANTTQIAGGTSSLPTTNSNLRYSGGTTSLNVAF